MKSVKLIILFCGLFLISCATHKKITEENQNENPEMITIPVVKNEHRPLLYNAQKIHTEQKNNFIYTVYYGVGGRYIVTIQPKNGGFIPFNQSDVSIIIEDIKEPETISFAIDENTNGVFTGFGNNRMGRLKFKLLFSTPETKDNSVISEELTIISYIKDIN